MDGKLWKRLYQIVVKYSDSRRGKYQQFCDREVLLWFLWAVINDRPVCWACQVENAPPELRTRRCPSASTLCRRLQTDSVLRLIEQIERFLTKPRVPSLCKYIDGKPLQVGHCSKDPHARHGHAGKGYRLYLITDKNSVIYDWLVRSNNTSEVKMAKQLIPALEGAGYLIGDGEYDANDLFDLASNYHHQLIAPRARPGTGFGHCRHSPARFRSVAILEKDAWTDNGFGKALQDARRQIERFFGNLTSFAGGLLPLPAWVRTLPRVTRWVRGKLIINAVRIQYKQQLRATMQ